MQKADLANEILSSVKDMGERHVSEFNKSVLLEVADTRFQGNVNDQAVEKARELLQDFLNRTWPEEPLAHKYVVYSCLALSFLFERPMHPQDKVHYTTRVENGKEYYYCSFHEKGTLCDFCAARPKEEPGKAVATV